MGTSDAVGPTWKGRFFAIWGGQAFSLVGSSVAGFALVWWLTKTTGSATVLAGATLATVLPQILLGPLAGAVVDRWSRRLIMIVADGGIAMVSLWLAYLFWSGAMRPWHVYAIMLARAVGGAFHWPAMQSSTSLMVPKRHLSRVAGVNQALQGGAGILSPPIGALLISILPLYAVMLIDVGTAAFAVLPLALVRIPQPRRSSAGAEGAAASSFLGDVKAGWHYVIGWPGLMLIVAAAVLLNFAVMPGLALIPILVTRHFGGQALQLAWLDSAMSLGFVVGGLALGVWGGFRRRILTAMMGVVGMGLGLLLVAAAPRSAFWLGLAGMSLAGVMNPMANGPIQAVIQATVDADMQGRVLTLLGSLCAMATPVSLLVAGPIADVLGIRFWYLVGGIITLLVGMLGFFLPTLYHFEEGRPRTTVTVPSEPQAHSNVEAP